MRDNGQLSWTTTSANVLYTLQWAPDAIGPWTNWPTHTEQPATSQVMSVPVPMFFRLSVVSNGGKFVPPGGKTLLMIGQDTNSIDRYTTSDGITPGGVMLYTSVQTADGLTSPVDYGGGVQFGQYLMDRYTQSVLQVGLYMVDALAGVTSGTFNANLNTLGSWMAGTHRPVYLRIGYEFDSPYNHYQPEAYAAAFRYIVDHFRGQAISNIDYVWHSYASSVSTQHLAWYPGDDYVDWFGVSIFGQVLGTNTHELYAMAHLASERRKPLMIAEAAPMGLSTTNGMNCWTSWFTKVFAFIQEEDVRAFCYINWNWDEIPMFSTFGWGDSRVQSDPLIQSNWLGAVTNGAFWNASPGLFERLRKGF